MDSVKLCMILFATGCVLSTCMALECNWETHYEYKGKCCQICPSGEFPIQHCKDSCENVCKKCEDKNDHCFCNKDLCEDDQCSKCSPNPECNQGDSLKRTGLYKFRYSCTSSRNRTKVIVLNPVLENRTRDERCNCQVYSVMVVCLAITGSVCLAMFIYLCIQRTREQRTKKKYPATSSSLKVPSDECVCKLSKEEMGEV